MSCVSHASLKLRLRFACGASVRVSGSHRHLVATLTIPMQSTSHEEIASDLVSRTMTKSSTTRVMMATIDSTTSQNALWFGAAAECHDFPTPTFNETCSTQAWHVLSQDEDVPVTP